jgi:hypothetical protein
LERGTEALSRIEIGRRERRLSPNDRRAIDDVLHLLFLVVSEKQRRIGRRRFEVCESCRQFIYAVWRDVSTRPDGSILKGPQCGEGFT